MVYEGTIYRPPSEAHSLLVQVTIGCAWNQCTFCGMYKEKKFRIRSMDEIKKDLVEGSAYQNQIRRIFLCDGDALVLPTEMLLELLDTIRNLYPDLEAVRAYASAKDVLEKSPEELRELADHGLEMMYLGLESGSDAVLTAVRKGITKQQMIDASRLLRTAGIKQSVSIISGLAGQEGSKEHILETADALSQMQPDYLGMLVLHLSGEVDLYKSLQDGTFRLPSAEQVLQEMHLLLSNLHLERCFFSSAHVSNYVDVRGWLPDDREQMIQLIEQVCSM